MLLVVLVCSLSLTATGQQVQDDWIDPHDMFNYNPSTKTMRKRVEPNSDIVTPVITWLQKNVGEGITEFHQAFKDLPGHLQITVSMTVALCILVFIYINCRPQRDPPPARLQEPQDHIQEIEDRDHLAGEDAPQPILRQQDNDDQLLRNQVRQRHINIPREEPGKVAVKTLHPAEPHNSEDEKDARLSEQEQNLAAEPDSENQQATDGQLHENQVSQRHDSKLKEEPGKVAVKTLRAAEPHNSEDEKDARLSEQEQNHAAESDSENQQETQEERAGVSASSAAANTAQSETGSDSSPSTPETAERRPSQTDVQDLQASAQDSNVSALLEQNETLPAPVQETRPMEAE